jgi:hypothetical protein
MFGLGLLDHSRFDRRLFHNPVFRFFLEEERGPLMWICIKALSASGRLPWVKRTLFFFNASLLACLPYESLVISLSLVRDVNSDVVG